MLVIANGLCVNVLTSNIFRFYSKADVERQHAWEMGHVEYGAQMLHVVRSQTEAQERGWWWLYLVSGLIVGSSMRKLR